MNRNLRATGGWQITLITQFDLYILISIHEGTPQQLSALTVQSLNLNHKPALATGNQRLLSILRSYPCYVHVLRSHIIIVQFDKDGRFQRCFLMLGGAAYFTTKGVQKVSVRRIIIPALCPLTEGRWCLQHVLKNIPSVGKV